MYPHLSQGDCLYKPLFYCTNFYIWTHQLHFVFWSFGKCDKYFARYTQLNYRKYEITTVQLCCGYEGEDRRSHCQHCVQAQNDSYNSITENGKLSDGIISLFGAGRNGSCPPREYGFCCYVSPSINVAKGTICIKMPLNDWASPLALRQWWRKTRDEKCQSWLFLWHRSNSDSFPVAADCKVELSSSV